MFPSFLNSVVVQARLTVDIFLDSSVVEHLMSDAGVPGSITVTFRSICISLYFSFICLFLPSLLQLVPWASLFGHLYLLSFSKQRDTLLHQEASILIKEETDFIEAQLL